MHYDSIMKIDNRLYAACYWALMLLIPALIITFVLIPVLLKEGIIAEGVSAVVKTPLLSAIALCGVAMWAYAMQRLAYVWPWSSTMQKISGVIFVLLFPGFSGFYLYYLDRGESQKEARRLKREQEAPAIE